MYTRELAKVQHLGSYTDPSHGFSTTTDTGACVRWNLSVSSRICCSCRRRRAGTEGDLAVLEADAERAALERLVHHVQAAQHREPLERIAHARAYPADDKVAERRVARHLGKADNAVSFACTDLHDVLMRKMLSEEAVDGLGGTDWGHVDRVVYGHSAINTRTLEPGSSELDRAQNALLLSRREDVLLGLCCHRCDNALIESDGG